MRPDALAPGDLRVCRALLGRGSKSFALAAHLLPPRVRDPATVLYAFCRIADDAVDTDPAASAATIDRLRARLAHVHRGDPLDDPVDRALAQVVAAHGIPRGLFEALLEGFAWDAAGRRYRTVAEVEGYAARVAGTVGALMSLIMDRRDPLTLARACDLGVAMQLTNIARDVGEDARRGRIYLPLDWLAEEGVDPAALLVAPAPGRGLAVVVRRLLAEADRLYARADAGIARLPVDCRAAIRAARLCYADIGAIIARAGWDPITRRAVVPRARKLWLLAHAAAGRPGPGPGDGDPPLEAARFLVAAAAGTTVAGAGWQAACSGGAGGEAP